MAFFGYHGPRAIEQEIGQHYQVDAVLYTDVKEAAEADDFSLTIDYSEIYETARQVITKHRFKLIETIAEKIAHNILAAYDINKVEISVRKLKPAIRGVMDYVEVTISRKKNEQ